VGTGFRSRSCSRDKEGNDESSAISPTMPARAKSGCGSAVGIGSAKGKTAGRGGKGQTARSGVRIKGFEAARCRCIGAAKRGSTTSSGWKFAEINLDRIQAGDRCQAARRQGPIQRRIAGESPRGSGAPRPACGLLGRGELKAKLNIEVHGASKSAIGRGRRRPAAREILAPPRRTKGGGVTSASSVRVPRANCAGQTMDLSKPSTNNVRCLLRGPWEKRGSRARDGGRKPHMVSAARTISGKPQFRRVAKADELKKRIWFTLGRCWFTGSAPTSRCPASIPKPSGSRCSKSQAGAFLGMFNMFPPAVASTAWRSLRSTSCRIFGVDHHSAPDYRIAATGGAEEGRRGGPQDAEPVHPLSHGDTRRVPVLWHCGRARKRRQRRQRTRPVSSACRRRSR